MRGRTTMLTIGVLALALTGCTAPLPPAPDATQAVDETVTSSDSVCGMQTVETTNRLTAAPTNQWELVGDIAVTAENSNGGPFVVRAGERFCFARTAYGALAAAVNYTAFASEIDPEVLAGLVPMLVAPGPGRDAALATPTALPNGALGSPQVAGFAIDAYDTDAAIIDLVWVDADQGGALISSPVSLQWVEGDWKVVLDDRAQSPLPAAVIDSLDGYLPWSDDSR
jgi:hypothetical protein